MKDIKDAIEAVSGRRDLSLLPQLLGYDKALVIKDGFAKSTRKANHLLRYVQLIERQSSA